MRQQKAYLLRRLQEAGSHGLHSWELRYEGIGNPSQRVTELEAEGHVVEHRSEPRDGCPGQRYVLVFDAERTVGDLPARPATEAAGSTGRPLSTGLFDAAPFGRGAYDERDAA